MALLRIFLFIFSVLLVLLVLLLAQELLVRNVIYGVNEISVILKTNRPTDQRPTSVPGRAFLEELQTAISP